MNNTRYGVIEVYEFLKRAITFDLNFGQDTKYKQINNEKTTFSDFNRLNGMPSNVTHNSTNSFGIAFLVMSI